MFLTRAAAATRIGSGRLWRPGTATANAFSTTRGFLDEAEDAGDSRKKPSLKLVVTSDVRAGPGSSESPDEPPTEKRRRRKSNFPRIYTRTGDGGQSSLFTGERRIKDDDIFEALGTTDELASYLGLALSYAEPRQHPYAPHLQRAQCILQDVGSALATPHSSARETHLSRTRFSARHTKELEEWIDEFSVELPALENFILPGGGHASSCLHISRSVCRRAERRIAPLVRQDEVDPEVLRYINRLSDFLFTLARLASRLDKKEETVYTRPDTRLFEQGGGSYSEGPDGIWKRAKPKKQE